MATSQTTKDYYATLGVSRGADNKQIKAAFRKLARKHHPDMNKGDVAAEERFKEVNEANDVLSDPASRKLYDRYGADWQRYREAGFTGDEPAGSTRTEFGGFPGASSQSRNGTSTTYTFTSDADGTGFSDLFGDLFGGRITDRFGSARRAHRSKGEDIEVGIEVSFDEAFIGTSRRLDVQTPEGTCPTCGGAGFVRGAPCPTCDGTGMAYKAKTIEVKIPAGVATGSRIRVAGQGGPGQGGGPKGDVWLNVTVRPDSRFERAGDDLKAEVEVPLHTAVLGGEAVVPTPTGKVALTVPAGAQNGRVFRLRGQGMPKLKKSGERGDLLARIKVAIPTNLSARERELFEELRSLRAR